MKGTKVLCHRTLCPDYHPHPISHQYPKGPNVIAESSNHGSEATEAGVLYNHHLVINPIHLPGEYYGPM